MGQLSLLEMPLNSLLLDRVVTTKPYETMFNWGMEQAPQEACGLVVMPGFAQVTMDHLVVLRMRNISSKPDTSYKLDIQALMETVFAGMSRQQFSQSVMVWHTHPGGHIGPSPQDLEVLPKRIPHCVVTLPKGEVITYERYQ